MCSLTDGRIFSFFGAQAAVVAQEVVGILGGIDGHELPDLEDHGAVLAVLRTHGLVRMFPGRRDEVAVPEVVGFLRRVVGVGCGVGGAVGCTGVEVRSVGFIRVVVVEVVVPIGVVIDVLVGLFRGRGGLALRVRPDAGRLGDERAEDQGDGDSGQVAVDPVH